MKPAPLYRNILLKISGESLAGPKSDRSSQANYQPFNSTILQNIAQEIRTCHQMGTNISIVIGGGNIYRGLSGSTHLKVDRVVSDHMGILATAINTLALSEVLKNFGLETAVFSSIPIPGIVDIFYKEKAKQALHEKKIVLFCGGTGNPYFTTDTAATLRALEMECDLLVKATKVSGVFCSDPEKNSNAEFYRNLTYNDILSKHLNVMDLTAISLAQDNNLPIAVYCLFAQNGLQDVLLNEGQFTLINAA